MAYRDDKDAREEQLAKLQKALAAANRELVKLRGKASDKELAAMTRERDALLAGRETGQLAETQRRAVVVAAIVLVGIGTYVVFDWPAQPNDYECEDRLTACERAGDELSEDLATAQRRLAETPDAEGPRAGEGYVLRGHVADVEGPASHDGTPVPNVGDACELAVRLTDTGCRATLACAGRLLFGRFGEEVECQLGPRPEPNVPPPLVHLRSDHGLEYVHPAALRSIPTSRYGIRGTFDITLTEAIPLHFP